MGIIPIGIQVLAIVVGFTKGCNDTRHLGASSYRTLF